MQRGYDRDAMELAQPIRVSPIFALAYNDRGISAATKSEFDRAIADFDHAIEDFNQAIKLNPKLAVAFGARGNSLASKADYERAIADLTQAIKLNPGQAIAFNDRGVVYGLK